MRNIAGKCVSSATDNDADFWFQIINRCAQSNTTDSCYWPPGGTTPGLTMGNRVYGGPEARGILNTAWDGSPVRWLLKTLQGLMP